MSGAMSASGITRHYKITVSELSYPIGVSYASGRQGPTEAEVKAEQLSWQLRLGDAMVVTDRWLAAQVKAKKLAPSELTQHTAMVAPLGPTQAGGPLLRPTLIELPSCVLAARNLAVAVRLALTTLPAPAERTALGTSLCAELKAADRPPDRRPALSLIPEVKELRDVMRVMIDGYYYVPTSEKSAVDKLRTDLLQQATAVMIRACRRFEKEHPGVTLQRVAGLGENAVRFSMELPYGSYDVLTEMVAAPGTPLPHPVALKDTMWADWQAAGLPMQTQFPALLKSKSQ